MVSELFFAKVLEILTTGLLEIGKFLQKQSVSIFRATAHICSSFNWVLSVTKKQLRIAVITVFSGLTYIRGERINSALYAFLNKRILDRRLNCIKNSYCWVLCIVIFQF